MAGTLHHSRILLLIPNLGAGGAQAVLRRQLEVLAESRTVFVCVFNTDGLIDADSTITLHSLDVSGARNPMLKLLNFYRRIMRLRKLKRQLNITVSISHLEGADYVNILSGVGKVVCWIHGSKRFDENISGVLGWIRHNLLMPLLYRRADHIVTVSHGIADEMENYLGGAHVPVKTVYNAIDIRQLRCEAAAEVPREYHELVSAHKVIAVHCRLSRQKNLVTLLTIFAMVRSTTPCKLVLIGDGEERDELLKLSYTLSLKVWTVWQDEPFTSNHDVYFLGFHVNAIRFVARAHLYVMTSLWEGFPLALCEAIAVGTPALAADCPTGPREIMHHSFSHGVEGDQLSASPFGVLLPTVTVNDAPQMHKWRQTIVDMLDGSGRLPESSVNTFVGRLDLETYRRAIDDVLDKVNPSTSGGTSSALTKPLM